MTNPKRTDATANQGKDVVASLGWELMQFVRQIDAKCDLQMNGMSAGLCNLKKQFQHDVQTGRVARPPREVKEEDALTWLFAEWMRSQNIPTTPWCPYPDSRKSCDLVAQLSHGIELWLEVKLAWKTWFNTNGKIGRSSAYLPYLLGSKNKTHSAADDFAKLVELAPPTSIPAILLVGFDSADDPMDGEVNRLVGAFWDLGWSADHIMWRDTRNSQFRIHCWFWQYQRKMD